MGVKFRALQIVTIQRDKTGVTFLSSNMSGSRVPVTMRDFFFDDPFFKNTWEDFDKVRDAMFNESRDMWKKFDDDFRNMACMSNNIMLESSARGAEEATQEKEKEVSQSEARSLMRQDSKSRWENGGMFPRRWMLPALNTDLPSNMDIFKDKKDNEVIRIKEDEDGTKMVSRMFSRKYTLPAATKQEEVASNLSSDGVLVITAPKKKLAIK